MSKVYKLVILLLLALPLNLRAQELPEGWSFGGWEFFEVYHDFGNSPFFA